MGEVENPRLVWLTADDLAQRRARIEYIVQNASSQRVRNAARALLVLQQEQEVAWNAAPADATEAVEAAMLENAGRSRDFRSNRGFAEAVLRALGIPK